ncbi:universal stress protein [Leifsonia sp. NPDC058248]|uniref:universal stress protein n=1 Tax=Leifsonia sp. NPDC058248 TaxID=3346402 RepID=UPI0036D89D41
MSEKIVVAVDGDPAHRAPVAWAVDRAMRTEAEIEMLYVIQRSWGDREPAPERLLVAAAQAVLDATADYAERRARTHASAPKRTLAVSGATRHTQELDFPATRWTYGRVAEELDLASHDGDLLVVGVHRTLSTEHAFSGSLGLRVASSAACSVALVPHDWAAGPAGVVVGVDGTLPSETALAFAADEAASSGETLTIVCAGFSANPLLAGLVPEISLGDRRQHIVDGAAEVVRDVHPDVGVVKRVVESSPASGLVTAAADHRMLVLGSRGRHGAKRALLGSVGHDVILNLRTPVVLARDLTEDGDA